jgi:hypothetical protein
MSQKELMLVGNDPNNNLTKVRWVKDMKWINKIEAGKLHVHRHDVDESTLRLPWADGVRRGAVHEFLFDESPGHPPPTYPALLSATRTLAASEAGPLVWCDPHGTLYPPAVQAALGGRAFWLLRPRREDLLWAVAECLKCPGVGVVVASVPAKLSRVEARRLQLAAEQGRCAGLLLRPRGAGGEVYAAASRWLVRPAPWRDGAQRWSIECLHGHGRLVNETFELEAPRVTFPEFALEDVPVRVPAPLADRAAASPLARSTA